MRVEIKQVGSYSEEEAVIHVVTITEEIQNAIDILDKNCRMIPVVKESETLMCRTDKIYYIESVDKHSYVYTKDGCYETKYRLYELEEVLSSNFLRCSKAMIINMRKIKAVKAELNGRMTTELLNGEQVVISRSYVKDLKRKLGL